MYGKITPLFRKYIFKALLLLAVLWVGGSLLFSRNGIITHYRLEKNNELLRKQIDSLELEIQRTIAENERLQNDTLAIEAMARKKFGYTKPGETPYIFKDKE